MPELHTSEKSYGLLDSVNSVDDIRSMNHRQLAELSGDIRDFIIDSVSRTGGHLASSLGVVELTVALHYIFNTPEDKIIWDVGHQAYAHKILTDRKNRFHTLRQFGGISGFPKIRESEFDAYDVGHSSTSLSLAAGEAVSRDLQGKDYKVVAVIGDGALSGGMSMEALNHLGNIKNDLIIILNDNEHSISRNVGAMSEYLTRLISGRRYNVFRKNSQNFIRRIPRHGDEIYSVIYKIIGGFKSIFMPGNIFRNLGIRYFGPIDGHNMDSLCETLERVKHINSGPKIIHVITKKGKGYSPAEKDPSAFHGVGPFDRKTGEPLVKSKKLSFSYIAGKTLAELSKTDDRLVAVTAAMKEGTGLIEFEKQSPSRFFDVGIAEQHAVTFSAALARTGMKPFVSIYSTFLQRAQDQLIHDIGIMNLPVKVLIDRAGIVGADGETHHGLFDVSLISSIPNFLFFAPYTGEELRDMIHFSASYTGGPVAIRFPKAFADTEFMDLSSPEPFVPGKIRILETGIDLTILALGDMCSTALEVRQILGEQGISVQVINLLSIRPLDTAGITDAVRNTPYFITLENGIASGGAGEHILAALPPELKARLLFTGAFPDQFIPQGANNLLFHSYGLDAGSLAARISGMLQK